MGSPNATTNLSFEDCFFTGPNGQRIPWAACILAIQLESLGYTMSRGLEPDSLRVRPPEGMEMPPELRSQIKTMKHHLLQVVSVALL